MKNVVVRLSSLSSVLIIALAPDAACAWAHANAYGGSTSHAYGSGSTTRSDAWGGSETHTYGQGTTATGRYGDPRGGLGANDRYQSVRRERDPYLRPRY